MEKMNKWENIQVVKAVRVVMKFQGAVALAVVMAVAIPELMYQAGGAYTHSEARSLDKADGSPSQ